jgi:spore germination protein YaaH
VSGAGTISAALGLPDEEVGMSRKLTLALMVGLGLGRAAAGEPTLRPHAEQVESFGSGAPVPFATADSFAVAGPPRVAREVLGFLPYWVSSPQLRWDLMTELLWFAVSAGPDGSITNLRGWPDLQLIETAQRNGVRVTLVVTNFDGASLTSLLSSPSARSRLIEELLTQVQRAGADGVNIDFEGVPAAQKHNLSAFMTALTDRFHTVLPGSSVTICTPAVDWSGAFDYDVLAENSDGLMIMGYGYHWSGSSRAGPVAPLRGGSRNLEWTVADYLHYGGAYNRSKFILGLPWYGYDWPTSSLEPRATTTGSGKSVTYSAARSAALQHGRLWDELGVAAWYRYLAGAQPHQAYYDDAVSFAQKLELINREDLGGLGIWALGYEGQRPELWDAIEAAFVPATGTVAVR